MVIRNIKLKKKRKKQSVVQATLKHDFIQKICCIVGGVFFIIIVIFLIYGIHTYINEEKTEEIDYKTLNYNQSLYDKRVEAFETEYQAFLEQYDTFQYSTTLVETASTVYYNDNAVQEMYNNLNIIKEDAQKILLQAEFFKDTFVTVNGIEDEKYPHLTNTLKIENTNEMKSLLVKIQDLTQQVDNSIVNVDFFNGYLELADKRKELVLTAESMLGLITYEWGGKPLNAGWNDRWNESGKGLDCSGFIQWVYWTSTGKKNETILSTRSISENQMQIKYEQLKPGDLGMIYPNGSCFLDASGNAFYSKEEAVVSNKKNGKNPFDVKQLTNHVGMYVGKDKRGRDLWIHCSGEADTVVKNTFDKFTVFYRVIE